MKFRAVYLLIISIILFPLMVDNFAQENTYFVDYNSVNGKLNENSQFKKGFGRYDGREISLRKNEFVNLFVYSEDFTPKLVLVDPDGNVANSNKTDKLYSTVQFMTPVEGEWIVYIVGKDSSVGDYTFQYAIADSSSMFIDEDASYCEKLSYLSAHSLANFRLFQFNQEAKSKLPDLSDLGTSFLDMTVGSYNSTFYDGENVDDAIKEWKKVTHSISLCLKNNWKLEASDWHKHDGVNTKMATFRNKKDSRFIISLLSEYEEEENQKHYSVELLIGSSVE